MPDTKPFSEPEDGFERHGDEAVVVAGPPGRAFAAPGRVAIILAALIAWLRERWTFPAFVVLPTLIAAAYLFFIAADQFQVETHFFVTGQHASEQSTQSSGEIGGSTSSGGGAEETLAVIDYLNSTDALRVLRAAVNLEAVYGRPTQDFLYRLDGNPGIEELGRYMYGFRDVLQAKVDLTSGVGVLKVRAFRAEDAVAVARVLMNASDDLVKRMSDRMTSDATRVASGAVDAAEAKVADAERAVTQFRLQHQDVDVTKSSSIVFDVVGGLEDRLAKAQSDLAAGSSYLDPGSPALTQLRRRISGLEHELAGQRERLAGAGQSMTPLLATWDDLKLKLDFAQKEYSVALDALHAAQIEADKQHLFMVPVVTIGEPESAEYPRRFMSIGAIFLSLSVSYAIGWLMIAGMREHAAA